VGWKKAGNLIMPVETVFYSMLSAIVGGLIVATTNHLLAARREIAQKQREIALSKLVDAWLLLNEASDRHVKKPDLDKLEEAVRLVVLFGDDKRIDEIESAANSLANGGVADWTSVQISLRKNIRQKLQIQGRDRHFWFSSISTQKASSP
jgi:hypothetical protein